LPATRPEVTGRRRLGAPNIAAPPPPARGPPDSLASHVLIGAEAIANEIGIDVRRCFHWLQGGYIPASKTGSIWTTTRTALRRHFSGEGEAR
jgi:hypothetical protein